MAGERGIDFQITSETETKLRHAGAGMYFMRECGQAEKSAGRGFVSHACGFAPPTGGEPVTGCAGFWDVDLTFIIMYIKHVKDHRYGR